jgi:hypothetical protein
MIGCDGTPPANNEPIDNGAACYPAISVGAPKQSDHLDDVSPFCERSQINDFRVVV